jgi:hypothetical protein
MTARKSWSLLAMMLAIALPASAHASVLYSQLDSKSTNAIASDEYSNSSSASLKVADDFTVPEGQSWRISRVDTVGVKDSQPLGSTVNAFLYASSGNLPGSELFRQTGIGASGSPNYSVPLRNAPKLSGGTFWVSIQQAGATFTQPGWYWSERTAETGNGAAVINPGGASTASCTDWTDKRRCVPADLNPDQLFSLSGDASSDPVRFAGLTRNTHAGTALLKVKVPGPGALRLGGRDVVPQSREGRRRAERDVVAAGTYKLLVTARGRAKRKLNRRGRVRVLAAAIYTSPGASPTSRTKRILLRKR